MKKHYIKCYSIILLVFAMFISREVIAIDKNNIKLEHEIQLLINRLLVDPAIDLKNYQKLCSKNKFQKQCISSHYLYHELALSKLVLHEEYISSLYNTLKHDLPNLLLTSRSEQTIESKIYAAVHQAVIGDALGFVIENESTVDSIKDHFPDGIINPKNLSLSLKNYQLKTKYGQYNNNNLNSDNKIIYSDDTELSMIVLYSALKAYKKDPSNINLFLIEASNNLAWHWHNNLKLSGKYGEDGLYYGTRGYGKTLLKALSDLYNHKSLQSENLNNGSLIRAWPLGLIPYNNYQMAAIMALKQSLITNKSIEVAIACATLAAGIHISIYDAPQSKLEVVDKMITTAESLEKSFISHDKNLLVSTYLKYAKAAALEDINPIIFYNAAIGYYSQETISAVVFSFLRHKYFLTALIESAHIPGDSDSVASLTSALMGAYYGIDSFPKEYMQYIETPVITLPDELVNLYYLTDIIISNLKNSK